MVGSEVPCPAFSTNDPTMSSTVNPSSTEKFQILELFRSMFVFAQCRVALNSEVGIVTASAAGTTDSSATSAAMRPEETANDELIDPVIMLSPLVSRDDSQEGMFHRRRGTVCALTNTAIWSRNAGQKRESVRRRSRKASRPATATAGCRSGCGARTAARRVSCRCVRRCRRAAQQGRYSRLIDGRFWRLRGAAV